MKVSIITVVYNGEKTIRDCINSVMSQTYPDIEYIVIDGNSTDSTLEIIHSYESKITKIISESDHGTYDAMNKGINLATGDIIAILNSDDMYVHRDTINKVIYEFKKDSEIECVYGDLQYVDQHNINYVRRVWKSCPYLPGLFKKGWHPAHPAFFVRKSTYGKFGLYRTDFFIASDYEMMLRLLEIKKIKSTYIPDYLVKMRTGGNSNKSLVNIIRANIEVLKAWKVNGEKVPYFIFFKKPFSKLKQFKI